MYLNGIVVQKYVDNQYKGIDGSGFGNTGENWYFNSDTQLSETFEPFYDEYINKTYWNLKEGTWVAACSDMNYIYRYIEESKKQNICYRLLLCETVIPSPKITLPECDKFF